MKKILPVLVCCAQIAITSRAMEQPKTQKVAKPLHVIIDLGVVVTTENRSLMPNAGLLSKLTIASTHEQPQIRELLEQLQQSGYTLSLLAEKKAGELKRLKQQHASLFAFFNGTIMTSGEAGKSKTSPNLYAHFFKTTEIDPRESIFVETLDTHALAAQQYGQQQDPPQKVTTILYEPSNNHQTVLDEIKRFLSQQTETTSDQKKDDAHDSALMDALTQQSSFLNSSADTPDEIATQLALVASALSISGGSGSNPLFEQQDPPIEPSKELTEEEKMKKALQQAMDTPLFDTIK